MILILAVVALVVFVHVVFPNRPAPCWPDGYYERTPEEIEADRRMDASIARCLATRGQFQESLRPTAFGYRPEFDDYFIRWPDGREEWLCSRELHARNLKPRLLS